MSPASRLPPNTEAPPIQGPNLKQQVLTPALPGHAKQQIPNDS